MGDDHLANDTRVVAYLAAAFRKMQEEDSTFSLRKFAAKIGIDVSILSRLLNGKRKLSFETAKVLLTALDVPLHVRNRLLLTLDENSRRGSANEDFIKHYLGTEHLVALTDWEVTAVHNALSLPQLAGQAELIAHKLGLTRAKVEEVLALLQRADIIFERDGKYLRKELNLFVERVPERTELLKDKIKLRIEKASEALAGDLSDSEFTSYCFAISKSKFQEAKRLMDDFALSLSRFLEGGEPDEVVLFNLQLLTLKDRS